MSKQIKSKAIIVDIDGTISDDRWRKHILLHDKVNWDDVQAMSRYDQPNQWCLSIIDAFMDKGYTILFVTARNERYRKKTIEWLNCNVLAGYELFMRPIDDQSPDTHVKATIYNQFIQPFYDVGFCIDDRESVAQMWRDIGIACLLCE